MSVSSALYQVLSYDSGLDESKLGDVLLFCTDEGSTCTQVCSPYSNTSYYTIVTEDLETSIYRGNGKGTLFSSSFVATVSTATSGHNRVHSMLSGFVGMMSGTSLSRGEQSKSNVNRSSPDEEEKECLLEKGSDSSANTMNTKPEVNDHRLMSIGASASAQERMLFIKLGKDAFSRIGDCLRIEKSSVTIIYGEKIYFLRVGQDGQPAIHAAGRKGEQVVWTRPPKVGAVDGKVATLHPASVTFSPEVRPFLDAILVALVVWEKMKGVSVQI